MGGGLTPEGKVKADCLEYLKRIGIFAWNNPTGALQVRPGQFMRFGYPGSSDIIGVCPDGRFLAVECKRPKGGRLSDKQREFLNKVNKLGGVAIVVCTVNALAQWMSMLGYVKSEFIFTDSLETEGITRPYCKHS